MRVGDIPYRNGKITINQLLALNDFQRQVFQHGVPYHLLKNFYNEFQLSAVIAKVGHDVAVSLDSIKKISDYFTECTELISNALAGLIPAVTMSKLMMERGSTAFNYVSGVTILVHDLIIEMSKAMHESKDEDADTSFESAFSDASSEDNSEYGSEEGVGFFGSCLWNNIIGVIDGCE
jgi:hypothetical protein